MTDEEAMAIRSAMASSLTDEEAIEFRENTPSGKVNALIMARILRNQLILLQAIAPTISMTATEKTKDALRILEAERRR